MSITVENNYVISGRVTSIAAQALLAVCTGGKSLLVTVPLVAFSGFAQGNVGEAIEPGCNGDLGYHREVTKSVNKISAGDNPDSQSILKGIGSSLSKTVLRPVAYAAIPTAFALDTVGYVFKPVGSLALMFTKNADANRRKFHKELPKFALTNTVRDVFQRSKTIAPLYFAEQNIRNNSLLAAPDTKKKKRKVLSN